MFEKVNPCHPDKVADRIAGAIVDYAYTLNVNPKVAAEVLIGHGKGLILIETSEDMELERVVSIGHRISGIECMVKIVKQDVHLSRNQSKGVRCGDNGIFKGCPVTKEQRKLSGIAREIYDRYSCDGKYILDENDDFKLIICQSNAKSEEILALYPTANVNPLGDWTGGSNVDSGATNRKLGSDMGDAVTGGGLHGKDLSKADVSVNIWCHLEAQRTGREVTVSCAIGDDNICGIPYELIVEKARKYIKGLGGFERFAEWGLI